MFEAIGIDEIPSLAFYKVAKFGSFQVNASLNADKWLMVEDVGDNQHRRHCIIAAQYFIFDDSSNTYLVCGCRVNEDNKSELFDRPFSSTNILIYKVNSINDLSSPKLYNVDNILCKLVCLPYAENLAVSDDSDDEESTTHDDDDVNSVVFVPLWHSLR